ncbi:MAG: hypothetical protein L3J23_01885 [Flavobacteriaceae bacterium]|nr:hypothetical protein [Flavobacteriaceae bacterium]
MKKIGSTMAIVGIIAIVMNFLDRVPAILIWIYSWGETTAWVIKIALVVIGAVLFFVGKKETSKEQQN